MGKRGERMSNSSRQKDCRYDHTQFHKGEMVLFEGKRARIVRTEPLLIIKSRDRIICGALGSRIKPIGTIHLSAALANTL